MRSQIFSRYSAAALALYLSLATAHPVERTESSRCAADSTRISTTITCGQRTAVQDCVLSYGSNLEALQQCLEEAGCATSETQSEATLVVERCTGEHIEVVELRQVDLFARETTTSTESTSTATSTSSTATSTDTSTTASTTASTTSASTTATSTDSSTTASSTSSSTASTTSSTSSSTSTSTSSSTSSGMRSISYVVAAILAIFTAACVGGICFKCCSERKEQKKERAAAEAKEALLASRH